MTGPSRQWLEIEGQEIVVLSYPCSLCAEQVEGIRRDWDEAGLPGKLVVLTDGAKLSVLGRDEQLDRIESLLTTLVESLADEGEEGQQEYTLDGEAVGGERDDSQPL
ncbi:hypothetical protein ACR55_01852 [Bordetella hinzii]|uniref:Uncharacterized protein n=1 Tax=Bordetella hinzii TaxID=103855 RepID=A0AAN1RZS8_9BORD|nr:hypothetical protein [Bordetella hinzii]AKQ59722.1 hypothetical protein ACR55_01852 [Bordetella hinzii]AZW19156.1 hypothetical protein CS347_21535 [Bordetella hinzii]